MEEGAARIRRYGHGCLRRRARPVDVDDPGTRALLDKLWATLAAEGGVGLAAPQIARDQRVVIALDPGKSEDQQRIELVNPVIRELFGPKVMFEEGCLSFPGLYAGILRPRGVVVDYDSPAGRVSLKDDGLIARIVQHEVDHLDGVLFIDRLPAWKRIYLLPRLVPFVLFEFWRRMFRKKRGEG